jgi:hypothetical protein
LVTLGLIALLVTLSVPVWNGLIRTRSMRAAASATIDSLERARNEAISSKRDVWVILKHASPGGQDALRIMLRGEEGTQPLGPWVPLPGGSFFRPGEGSIVEERPPGDIVTASLGGVSPGRDDSFGGVKFARSGGIAVPARGGNSLSIPIGNSSGTPPVRITLSRGTGRTDLAP